MADLKCYCCHRLTECYIIESLENECEWLRDSQDATYKWKKILNIMERINEYDEEYPDGHMQILSYPPCPR